MAEFYRFPYWVLTILVMTLALCIILQTGVVIYSIRRLCTSWVYRAESAMECVILAVLFLFTALLAQVQYALFCGFLAPSGYEIMRQIIVLLVVVLGTVVAMGTGSVWLFFAVGGATILHPVVEKLTGSAYPFFFLASVLFFLLRSVHLCLLRWKEFHTQLSSVSIKEAIDTLHTGLLFFHPKGEILLCNHQMDVLAKQIMGKPLHNGREFQHFLECGSLPSDCAREVLEGQQVFRIPDSSIWSISTHTIPIGSQTLTLLTADDVTDQWNAVTLLAHENQVLEERGQELRNTIEHLQTICEAEEIARSKGRVHDLLGQHISLLLRTLRDGQQLDEAFLMDFIQKLPEALREDQVQSPAHRIEMLQKTFQGMEVSVEVCGELPSDVEVANNFAEIAIECVTNAVRHGYATCIQFHFFQNDCWRMTVTDNGIPPTDTIREGGGISEMRRRINHLGGTLELHTVPRFSIQICVPKEVEWE